MCPLTGRPSTSGCSSARKHPQAAQNPPGAAQKLPPWPPEHQIRADKCPTEAEWSMPQGDPQQARGQMGLCLPELRDKAQVTCTGAPGCSSSCPDGLSTPHKAPGLRPFHVPHQGRHCSSHPPTCNSRLTSFSQEFLLDLLLSPHHNSFLWPCVKPGSNKRTLRQALAGWNPLQ